MCLLLFLLFISINSFSQRSILIAPLETHEINVKSLQLNYSKPKERIFTYYPFRKVKLTIKAGLNSNSFSKVNVDTLLAGDINDAFNDVDSYDAMMILRYDARLKFYLTKRWRFLMRAQILGYHTDIYTFGVIWKV